MKLYAGTTTDRDGQVTQHYTDTRDCLPCDIQDFREFLYDPAMLPWAAILHAIREAEADGERICWQVGDRYYATSMQSPVEGPLTS